MSLEQLKLIRSLADQSEAYTELLQIAAQLIMDEVITKENAAKQILQVAQKLGENLAARIA